jgi:hypothetical protein
MYILFFLNNNILLLYIMNELINLVKPKPKPIKEKKEKILKLKDIFIYKKNK